MKEEEMRVKYLKNALVLFAASYNYLKGIDASTFDVEFELPSEFEIGLSIINIEYIRKQKLFHQEIIEEIIDFREYLLAIPDAFWVMEEFEKNPIWENVRSKSNSILDKLKISNREYDFLIVRII